ncbi:MAG: CpXC domain-containing protein [Candidatus Thorarchaeota archaeon]
MTKPEVIKVTCPHCRYTFSFCIWAAIDANKHPELIEGLLSEDVWNQSCPNCKVKILLTGRILIDGPHGFFWLEIGDNLETRKQVLRAAGVLDRDGQVVSDETINPLTRPGDVNPGIDFDSDLGYFY